MAKVIEFYIPDIFRRSVYPVARTEFGKLIEFCLPRGQGVVVQLRKSPAVDAHTKEGAIPMWTFCS